MYGAATGDLQPYLGLKIERGTGGGFGTCAGFSGSTVYNGTLAAFATAATGFTTGVGAWAPATSTASQVYRITLTLSTDPAAAGLSASGTFTWEARADPYQPDWTNTYALTVLGDSPFAFWQLDETSGTSAADSAGTRTATHTNMTVGAGALHPRSARGVTATGTNTSRTTVPVDDGLRLNGSFTIEFWYQRNSNPSSFPNVIYTGNGSASNTGWLVYWDVNNGRLTYKRDAQDLPMLADSSLPVTAAHIVIAYDEPTRALKGYLNGALSRTWTVSPAYVDDTGSSNPFSIGSSTTVQLSSSSYDDVALYATALSAERIAAH